MHILVVEDERRLAALMSRRLLEERHTADVIRDGITGLGLALATNAGYDVIVLDRMLSGLDGLELCRSIRAAGIAVPVLMVSARQEVADCVAAFEAGADDYLAKPFALEELLARVHALGRRSGPLARAPAPGTCGGEYAAPEAAARDGAMTSRGRGLIESLRHAWARALARAVRSAAFMSGRRGSSVS
jgi:DNA-binding response OmpR family regulator